IRTLISWLCAIVVVSALVPLVEQSIARVLQMIPTQIDLIRGLRFCVPILLLGLVWSFHEIGRTSKLPIWREDPALRIAGGFVIALSMITVVLAILFGATNILETRSILGLTSSGWIASCGVLGAAVISVFLVRLRLTDRLSSWIFSPRALLALGVLLLGVWTHSHNMYPGLTSLVVNQIDCWRSGEVYCPDRELLAKRQLLDAISQHVPPSTPILTTVAGLEIRYVANRPVVYLMKDGGILSYTNHEALIEWDRRRRMMESALTKESVLERLDALIQLCVELEATYLVIDFDMPPDWTADVQILWASPDYAILNIRGTGGIPNEISQDSRNDQGGSLI
ncbi:hypothetical protein KAJ02_07250, partial [Candidatus Bipolaricaulota bacterium]|nr:hypothetical protein [Candidatus Bipolaricaulota bacterium]